MSASKYIGMSGTLTKTVTEADIVNFAGVSGDFNPLHLDAEYGKSTRFGSRIAHGMLSASYISAVIAMRMPWGYGGVYLGQELKFVKPVLIGDTVKAVCTVESVREDKNIATISTIVTNQRGEEVITGKAVVLVPKE